MCYKSFVRSVHCSECDGNTTQTRLADSSRSTIRDVIVTTTRDTADASGNGVLTPEELEAHSTAVVAGSISAVAVIIGVVVAVVIVSRNKNKSTVRSAVSLHGIALECCNDVGVLPRSWWSVYVRILCLVSL